MCLCVCAHVLSHVRLFAAPWTEAHQAPLSLKLSKQAYWSVMPFPPSRNLPDPEMEPHCLCLQHEKADSLPLAPPQSVQFSSVTQSCPTLRPHESQHARPPCPSPISCLVCSFFIVCCNVRLSALFSALLSC